MAFLPAVGFVTGALAGGIAVLASLVVPHTLVVALAFGLSIALTGALHLDGLLDCADALFAPVSVERRFEILKDPGHGTFALAVLIVVAAVWLAALDAVPVAHLPLALGGTAALARASTLLNAYRLPYGRVAASASAFATRPNAAIVSLGFALAAICALAFPLSLVALPIALVVAFALGGWIARRLGGALVGDAYGAIIVLVEVTSLVVVAACEWNHAA